MAQRSVIITLLAKLKANEEVVAGVSVVASINAHSSAANRAEVINNAAIKLKSCRETENENIISIRECAIAGKLHRRRNAASGARNKCYDHRNMVWRAVIIIVSISYRGIIGAAWRNGCSVTVLSEA